MSLHPETDYDFRSGRGTLRLFRNGAEAAGDAAVLLEDSRGNEVFRHVFSSSGADGEQSAEVGAVLPWSPDSPALYRLSVSLPGNREWRGSVGFRRLERRGGRVFWNGEAVKLRGLCCREKPEESLAKKRRCLELYREANVNYLRSIYGPFSAEFLALCDELGFWAEDTAPLWNVGEGAPALQDSPADREEKFLAPMRRMLSRDGHHVSVLLWSLGQNCVWGGNFRAMLRMVRRADPVRLVNFHQPMTIPLQEEQPDVWSVYYLDSRLPADEHFDQMVIFHTPGAFNAIGYETGRAEGLSSPVLQDLFAPLPYRNLEELESDPGVREFWARSLKAHWEAMEKAENCLGGAVLAAEDEEDGREGEWSGCRWGVLDTAGRPKAEYFHLRMTYLPKPALSLEETDEELRVVSRRFCFRFSRSDCRLAEASADGVPVLTGGPYAAAEGIDTVPWRGTGLTARLEDGDALVTVRGNCGGSFDAEFRMKISPDGTVETSCTPSDFQAFMPHAVKAGIGMDPGGLQVKGIAFRTAPGAAEFAWERDGLWDWYPQGHPGANCGRADASEELAFRSMKHNVRRAEVKNPRTGAQILVLSDGSQAVRLEASPDPRAVLDDTDPRLEYRGEWRHIADPCGDRNGTESLSGRAGDSVTLRFRGTGVSVRGPHDVLFGKADFLLDGRPAASGVSQYPRQEEFGIMSRGWEKRYRVLLFRCAGLPEGEHELTVRVTGEKEANAQETYCAVDSFEIESPEFPAAEKLTVASGWNYRRLAEGNHVQDAVMWRAGETVRCRIRIGKENLR